MKMNEMKSRTIQTVWTYNGHEFPLVMDDTEVLERYDAAVLALNEANNVYDTAKKSAADARTAYDEAKRALDVANMLKAEDAQSVKDAKAAYEAALKEYEEKAAAAKEKQEMYETDKEYSQKDCRRHCK